MEEVKTEVQEENIVIKEAKAAAENLRIEREKMEKVVKELKELQANNIIGGRSIGRPQDEKPKDIDPQEYSRLAMSGKLPERKK